MIQLQEITKIYQNQKIEALKGIDLHVKKGEIFGVIGLSGAGKSSLIRCINYLERPTSGRVLINNVALGSLSKKALNYQRRKISMVFQQFNLLQSKTVFENIAMPLVLAKHPKDVVTKRVRELLAFVGLAEKENQYPSQLSGGQKQRVGIARALATQPDILLCDEATSALDPETTKSILELLRKIRDEYQTTILLITHEMNVICDICDRVAVLEDGSIVEQGAVLDVFSKPTHQTTKKFVRSIIQDDLPESIFRQLQRQTKNHRSYHFIFNGDQTTSPFLSMIAKNYELDVNILFGSIQELQETTFGHLVVDLQGEEDEIQLAVKELEKSGLTVKEVVRDGI